MKFGFTWLCINAGNDGWFQDVISQKISTTAYIEQSVTFNVHN